MVFYLIIIIYELVIVYENGYVVNDHYQINPGVDRLKKLKFQRSNEVNILKYLNTKRAEIEEDQKDNCIFVFQLPISHIYFPLLLVNFEM